MKFVVAQQDMVKVLNHITSVLERTQTRDVLSHARVVVSESGELLVSCTNLQITMVARKQLDQVEEPGSATIPGLRLFDIFRRIPSDAKVYFETVENMIEISFGRSKFTLNLMTGPNVNVLDRQTTNPPDDHITVKIKAGVLRSLLHYTNPIMGSRDPRVYQMGTCFEATPTHFRTVSTVSTVLALATTEQKNSLPDSDGDSVQQYLVPRKTVLQISSMLGEVDGGTEVDLVLGTNHVSLEVAPFTLTSTLMDVQYPDYKQVFPKEENWTILCNREQLRTALDQVEVVAVDSSHRVSWEFNRDLLTLRSASTRNDKVNTEVAIEEMTAPRKLSLNGERALRVLSTMRHEKLQISSMADEERSNLVIRGVRSGAPSEDNEPIAGVEVAYLFAPMSER